MDEISRNIVSLANTMENIFRNLVDEFGDKTNLIDDLKIEVKYLSHAKNVVLKENIYRLVKDNTNLANDLQAFVN